MFRTLASALLFSALSLSAAQAVTVNEITEGVEFGDAFTAPSDFTGASRVEAFSNGTQDFEYFRFDTLFSDTTELTFTLTNRGAGSNMNIRLSSTPFTMAEWDWRITPLVNNAELYANQWNPTDDFTFVLPEDFSGPLYGFARFYGTRSDSSLVLTQNGTAAVQSPAPVPLPAGLWMLMAGLGGLGLMRARRRV
ncbi:VPLPA-CTERM sorting domain-containing protein [Gymnodinialimonas sp. 2305UL16-5]|uniref:VPLPA-CTERM sorting domain-containing protein n=1 Tax=Gymnodinialimonas mytili TaxID=3126503 RepID=UPI0030AD937A